MTRRGHGARAGPSDARSNQRLYQKAAGILNRTVPSPANSQIDYDPYPPFPPRWHKLADVAIPRNGPALALMRQARDYRRFDWGIRPTSPAYAVLLPHLGSATVEARTDMGEKVIINLKTWMDGHRPPDRVLTSML